MKIINQPIEVIAWFMDTGVVCPLKFRLTTREGLQVYKVEQIVAKKMEKLAGNRMMVFECQSEIDGVWRPFVIKYELETMRWLLFKI
ncbi:MAG: hypothetical protein WAO24_07825 [Peptococcia bacterium]